MRRNVTRPRVAHLANAREGPRSRASCASFVGVGIRDSVAQNPGRRQNQRGRASSGPLQPTPQRKPCARRCIAPIASAAPWRYCRLGTSRGQTSQRAYRGRRARHEPERASSSTRCPPVGLEKLNGLRHDVILRGDAATTSATGRGILAAKGRALPFSFFPVTRNNRRYGLYDAVFAVNPWSVMRGAVDTQLVAAARRSTGLPQASGGLLSRSKRRTVDEPSIALLRVLEPREGSDSRPWVPGFARPGDARFEGGYRGWR